MMKKISIRTLKEFPLPEIKIEVGNEKIGHVMAGFMHLDLQSNRGYIREILSICKDMNSWCTEPYISFGNAYHINISKQDIEMENEYIEEEGITKVSHIDFRNILETYSEFILNSWDIVHYWE